MDLIWDFDGTLMDSYPSLVRVMLDAGKRIGVALDPARVLDLMKDNLRHAIRVIGEENGMSFEAFNAIFREEEKSITPDEVIPLPGIPETLRTLKARGGRHFLLTHRDNAAWVHLVHWGLAELFDGMAGGVHARSAGALWSAAGELEGGKNYGGGG